MWYKIHDSKLDIMRNRMYGYDKVPSVIFSDRLLERVKPGTRMVFTALKTERILIIRGRRGVMHHVYNDATNRRDMPVFGRIGDINVEISYAMPIEIRITANTKCLEGTDTPPEWVTLTRKEAIKLATNRYWSNALKEVDEYIRLNKATTATLTGERKKRVTKTKKECMDVCKGYDTTLAQGTKSHIRTRNKRMKEADSYRLGEHRDAAKSCVKSIKHDTKWRDDHNKEAKKRCDKRCNFLVKNEVNERKSLKRSLAEFRKQRVKIASKRR